MTNLGSISNQLTKELNGLEHNFSEQLGRLKTLEAHTMKKIARLRKILLREPDSDWAYQLPNMVDLLTEIRKSIEQIETLCLPEDDIEFESIEDITNEDVLI